jgi:hypothetical protein
MSHASRTHKLRCFYLGLCLTIACAMFTLLDTGARAGATMTPPTISKISPRYSPITGGTSIVITGTGFENGAAVVVGLGIHPCDKRRGGVLERDHRCYWEWGEAWGLGRIRH